MTQLSLLQFEGFAIDTEDIRNAVIEGGFKTETGPDGFEYTGISQFPVPHWHELMAAVMGRETLDIKLCGFRLNLEGELPHSWVHSDEICQAEYASILYMNLPHQCQGGTAFWRHEKLGLSRLPTIPELKQRDIDPDPFYEWMNGEWKDLTNWRQVGFVGMQWNRLIIYPTCYFHSRYPFEGFGKTPEDGRLVFVSFFNV